MASHIAAVVVLALAFLAAGIDSYAATLVVTKTADTADGICDADCSLREAVAVAASGDTVVFSPLFNSPQTITLIIGQIAIARHLTVAGPGSSVLTVSGNNTTRVFHISAGADVLFVGLTVADGRNALPNNYFGGGIYVADSSLTLTHVTVRNNVVRYTTQNPVNDFGQGGGIYCLNSRLIIIDSTISHNTAPIPGVAFLGGGSGIYSSESTVEVTNSSVSNNFGTGIEGGNVIEARDSTFVDNTSRAIMGGGGERISLSDCLIANNAGGVGSGDALSILNIDRCMIRKNDRSQPFGMKVGGITNSGTAMISNSVVRDHYSTGKGGGIRNLGTMYVISSAIVGNRAQESGGGIYNVIGRLFLTNSTISGNIADSNGGPFSPGGGIHNFVNAVNPGASIVITNSTISGNVATGNGGGIRSEENGSVVIRNTIVAGNTSVNPDVSALVESHGFNLIGNTIGSSGWIASDLLSLDPVLAPLGNNGGGTLTHAVLPGSPAMNAGSNALALDPLTDIQLSNDQRGFARRRGGSVDIGAYEADYSPSPVTISGQVKTAIGRGISNVRITFTDSMGVVRYSQTNPFGHYRFVGLSPGQTYTITVAHKRFTFGLSQVVTADRDRDDLNFSANPQ